MRAVLTQFVRTLWASAQQLLLFAAWAALCTTALFQVLWGSVRCAGTPLFRALLALQQPQLVRTWKVCWAAVFVQLQVVFWGDSTGLGLLYWGLDTLCLHQPLWLCFAGRSLALLQEH